GWGLADARAEGRFKLLDRPLGLPLSVAASAGYQRDWQQQNAAGAAPLLLSGGGRGRICAHGSGPHFFPAGPAARGVFATAGAAMRLTDWLQGGVEYLGEELEGVGGSEVDAGGGGRHFIGPSTTNMVPHSTLRLNMTAGPEFTPVGSGLLVRGSVGYVFWRVLQTPLGGNSALRFALRALAHSQGNPRFITHQPVPSRRLP